MTDIEKAADVAASVLPGPIGEALARFLSDGVATDDADSNPFLADLVDRIVYVDEIREGVGVLYPRRSTDFYYGMALQFAVTGELATASDAMRFAEIAISYLFAFAPNAPAAPAPRGYVNATARAFFLNERIAMHTAELNEITEMLGGNAS